ncbi:iron uptake transporter deferrochelatase/peroxidase subunit [Humibacter ginsenosidimutans]|uniref:Deferrochelatase n=1 Tax=Humibacter ginsenosidimutans TaxID=2599293 RepID=A0A5B8M7K1_9MICO|nr:iron uptake transporter deferrochelatase/peroxidase subunit [Humibacter ginsenosidimutans]QDZ15645.1 deferrochelatase/peroxidase EfeB [Humibacter ginsenosidimutans]
MTGVVRRDFLAGVFGAGVAAPLVSATAVGGSAFAQETVKRRSSYPFHGEHQQGIVTPAQSTSAFVAFDVTVEGRKDLEQLLRTITERARFLTSGGRPDDTGITGPPSDSGLLGAMVPADGLTVTLSLGASLFDDRLGLGDAKPARLRTMEDFPNDDLDRSQCDGDLLLQICAHHPDTVLHALRDLTRATRGGMQIRWRKDGFVSPPRPSGTPRNLLGFKDGTASPATASPAAENALVWTRAVRGEPAWVAGGSYHVVRLIRMLVEFWDRVSIHEQENMIGRRRDSGAPLTGSHEFDDPHYELDPTGDVIQLDAHIRLANPRTTSSESEQMLRRPYNYDSGVDPNGNLDMGLIFACFNQDLDRQFVAVQKRLVDEPLVDYISPVGGGYFFSPPGAKTASDWLASGAFA